MYTILNAFKIFCMFSTNYTVFLRRWLPSRINVLKTCFTRLTTSDPLCLSLLQAFSVFFVCVAFTSDIICLLFIPVQWLFFAASTYVWVQYVWHTGRASLHLHRFLHLDVQRTVETLCLVLRVSKVGGPSSFALRVDWERRPPCADIPRLLRPANTRFDPCFACILTRGLKCTLPELQTATPDTPGHADDTSSNLGVFGRSRSAPTFQAGGKSVSERSTLNVSSFVQRTS